MGKHYQYSRELAMNSFVECDSQSSLSSDAGHVSHLLLTIYRTSSVRDLLNIVTGNCILMKFAGLLDDLASVFKQWMKCAQKIHGFSIQHISV